MTSDRRERCTERGFIASGCAGVRFGSTGRIATFGPGISSCKAHRDTDFGIAAYGRDDVGAGPAQVSAQLTEPDSGATLRS